MESPITYAIDDKDLDDAALWAVIDSAAASSSAIRPRKPHLPPRIAAPHRHCPVPFPASISSPPSRTPRTKHSSRSPEPD
ncbi:hypothetical protein RJ639_025896 [Escallonia herrerae]|uniref:Uncharacterized protein n=1 Tax=Escallonia herrerae TaxID=1293975 RepID=A0AA88UWZ8_9ASTE|nr:hypothetical protein RJ639_025896 [Escallonia herrerae]